MTLMRGRGLVKTYERGSELVHALEDATVELHGREVVALVGPSGSGKTTLLYLLAGWETPNDGRIEWDGEAVLPGMLRWNDLALVPQSLGLIEELTVRENVALPLRLAKVEIDDRRIEHLLSQLGLTRLADRYPLETSLGEQQRSALARALVVGPRLILADEPTGHQDAGWAEAVFHLLRRAAAEGSCCLIATHDRDVARYADRVISMRDGRIDEGHPSETLERRRHSIWAPRRAERGDGR